jgi:hypothetical protein
VSWRPARLPIVLLLVLAALLLWSGGRLLLAGIADYQAEAFILDWEKSAVEPGERAWEVGHAAAQRAVELYPVADGERLDRLGRIYSWKQFRQPYGAAEAEDSRRAALQAYREAVSVRPLWPYTWARLAHTKLYLLEIDDEFSHAFNQAFSLGPWRIGVNRELAQIGLIAWPKLDIEQRQKTLESIRRTSAFSAQEARKLLLTAQQVKRLQTFCAALGEKLSSKYRLDECRSE